MMEIAEGNENFEERRDGRHGERNPLEDFIASPRLLPLNGNSRRNVMLSLGSPQMVNHNSFEANDQRSSHHHQVCRNCNDKRISSENGASSSSPRSLFPPDDEDHVHVRSSVPSTSFSPFGYGLLSTQRLDSFLDRYENKHRLEPLKMEGFSNESVMALIEAQSTKSLQISVKDNEQSERNMPSSSLRAKSLPTQSANVANPLLNSTDVKASLMRNTASRHVIKDDQKNEIIDYEELRAQDANCNFERDNSKRMLQPDDFTKSSRSITPKPGIISADGNAEESQVIVNPTVRRANNNLYQVDQQPPEMSATDGGGGGNEGRANTEVGKSHAKLLRTSENLGVGGVIPPQQPLPQHIDNSKDSGNSSEEMRRRALLIRSSNGNGTPETLPSTNTSSSKPSASGSAGFGEITGITPLPSGDRNSESRIPMPLPKTKSKSVKEVANKVGIPHGSSSQLVKPSEICDAPRNPSNSLTQQVDPTTTNLGTQKAEVIVPNEVSQMTPMHNIAKNANSNGMKPSPMSQTHNNIRQASSEPNQHSRGTPLNNKPPQIVQMPGKRNIGQGDEVSDALDLIDGLSGHTSWIIKKLLEVPVSDKDAAERLKRLQKCPDFGDFFGAPYMAQGARGHLYFGTQKPPILHTASNPTV